jgi:hypothetical protein
VNVYMRGDGLAGTLIADGAYPARVAFTVLTMVLEEFAREVPYE